MNSTLFTNSTSLSDLPHAGSLILLAGLLAAAVYTELRENRIPNWLTIPGMMMGVLLGYAQGQPVFARSIIGLVLGFLFLYVFYAMGGVGGGDVKLMGAAGALLGSPLTISAVLWTALVGLVMGLLMVIWQRNFWARLGWNLRSMAFWRNTAATEAPEKTSIAIPYGIAIAVGCLLALFVQGRS
jgi:prepilin peptidase CpaA